MPKLWNQTIEEHRRAVHDAIVDTAAALVAEHGPARVTMSRIAQETGIGRATLYKYFPDVDAILVAWHERQVAEHLRQLAGVADRPGDPVGRLAAVLRTYAAASTGHPAHDPGAALHRGEHLAHARRRVLDVVAAAVTDAVTAGLVRDDVPVDELAAFCVNAMAAGNDLPPTADRVEAIDRLVTVTMTGIGAAPCA
ncbi:TetR/AcrR family transcriptional regulator [Virgisporangium ochraceum]|uniref:HTH tetR-type domain-containing protein n=1 Tax=Virgisporangium ochraceum TaxID=65505 RepID=A0A8J4A816_9ACTN|nr:TetR/AcrR family transcriptional regulator [Virgisporangium ochraceum]GIJ75050.1 hypothetical protein Voc01_099670 [Virgisporangium ochraceum]